MCLILRYRISLGNETVENGESEVKLHLPGEYYLVNSCLAFPNASAPKIRDTADTSVP